MYDYLVYGGIIIILICLGYKYINWRYIFKKPEKTTSEETEVEDIPEPDTPLSSQVFIEMTAWKEEKDAKREKDIYNLLDGIHFWISIIGFYVLMKMIFAVGKFTLAAAAGKELLDILNQFMF